jgi:hypothetical protein
MPKDAVSTGACIVELVPWRLIVPKVDELTCVQIEMVRPVLVLTTGIQHDELLIVSSTRSPETSQIPDARQQL